MLERMILMFIAALIVGYAVGLAVNDMLKKD
jgi:hypothetical protein